MVSLMDKIIFLILHPDLSSTRKPMTKNEYVACPLCGMNKIFRTAKREKKGKSEELKWPSIDLNSYSVLQVREGGGKKAGTGAKGRGKAPGSGFHLIPSESLTLKEMIGSPEYDDILRGMKEQLIRVIRDALEVGFIKRKDLATRKSEA
jgi:hypothetical protein